MAQLSGTTVSLHPSIQVVRRNLNAFDPARAYGTLLSLTALRRKATETPRCSAAMRISHQPASLRFASCTAFTSHMKCLSATPHDNAGCTATQGEQLRDKNAPVGNRECKLRLREQRLASGLKHRLKCFFALMDTLGRKELPDFRN
jgi:hypothetical protein